MMAPTTGPGQVNPPGGQAAQGEVRAEASGRIHRRTVERAAHGALDHDVGPYGQRRERPLSFGPWARIVPRYQCDVRMRRAI